MRKTAERQRGKQAQNMVPLRTASLVQMLLPTPLETPSSKPDFKRPHMATGVQVYASEKSVLRVRVGPPYGADHVIAVTEDIRSQLLASGATRPEHVSDRLSAGYLTTLAGRTVHEVGALARLAEVSGQRLPTFTIDTEVGFRSPEDRAAFAEGLTSAVLDLVSRYHHDDGHVYRVIVAAHPKPGGDSTTEPEDSTQETP